MSEDLNIHPQHLNYTAEGSTSTHSTLHSMYGANSKGFFNYAAEGSTSSHSSLKNSGFQYILQSATVTSITETTQFKDTATVIIQQAVTEFLRTVDTAQAIPAQVSEASKLADSATVVIRQNIQELLTLAKDSASGKGFTSTTETTRLSDSASVINKQTATQDLLATKESVTVRVRINPKYTVRIHGNIHTKKLYTAHFGTKTHLKPVFGVQIVGSVDTLVGVTATGTSSGSGQANPINPVVAVSGVSLIGSAPAGAATSAVYIELPNTGTQDNAGNPVNWQDMPTYSSSLDYSGGTFNLETRTELAHGGQTIPVFGLHGTVTNPGFRYNNSTKAFVTSGIYGNPMLNKQFRFMLNAAGVLASLNAAGTSTTTLGAKTIALAVARICGINLIWTAQDIPVTNFIFEPTMNGITALQSMAQKVNAVLRWDGYNTYYVAYPIYTVGQFVIPDVHLLGPGGIEGYTHYDLETGIGGAVNLNTFGTPIQTLSTYTAAFVNANAGLGINVLPNSGNKSLGGLPSPLQPVGSMTKKLTTSDPPQVFSLPANYQDIMMQILVGPAYTTTSRYFTKDPTVWDTFTAPGVTGTTTITNTGVQSSEYVYQVYEGGSYVPKVKIDSRIFPNHPAINAGNFTLNLACTLKTLSGTDNVGPVFRIPQYVQTFSGTINCVFFGVMPMPGMYTSVTLEDKTVSGIIESVSFTPPGFLQLQVARYTQILWTTPSLDYNLGP